nr:MAG TPA: nuclear pore complex protein [Microviridae sp.]
MGFGKSFIEGLASSGASSLTGVVTGGLSQALGLSWSPRKAMEEQWKYNKNIMALQNQYQQQAAAKSQQYAKDYWDYTNTENQVAHLKNAGLNIGLMYGQSGAGGMGASGGAHQATPEQPQGNPVAMALQTQQIEQQRRMNDAQIALAEAQARKADEEANKIGGVDIEEAKKRIEEMDANIKELIASQKLKEAEEELTKAKKETENTIQRLNESKEALSRAEISQAFAVATYYSEMAHKVYWEYQREKLGYQYDKETLQDRIDSAYYMNCQIIALIAKTYKDIEVGDAQIKQLEAAAKELNELADKHDWDKETYRKEVEGMIERWAEQTFNERLQIGLQFGENIAEMFFKLRGKKSQTKSVSTKKGKQIVTETYTESY